MGLFDSLKIGESALRSQQVALQTVGHNISNATTEGYTRQRVVFQTTRPQDLVFAHLGTGVQVAKIERVINQSLETAIQDAKAEQGSLQVQTESLRQLESIFNQFTEGDLDTALGRFFDALEELADNPEEAGVRELVLAEAQTLTDKIRFVGDRLDNLREQLDSELVTNVNSANTILTELAQLNGEIVRLENGGERFRSANDLRDRRDYLLGELSEIVDIRTSEESTGSINVSAGSVQLVFRQTANLLSTDERADNNVSVHDVRVAGGALLPLISGELEGAVKLRDTVLPGFLRQLDEFTQTFTDEFNKLHSQGRGLERFSSLDSRVQVHEKNQASVALRVEDTVTIGGLKSALNSSGLAAAFSDDELNGLKLVALTGENAGLERTILDFNGTTGQVLFSEEFPDAFSVGDRFAITSLDFPPEDGAFDLVITSQLTGATKSFNIDVDLDGIGVDDHLSDVVGDINTKLTAFYGVGSEPVVASVTSDNRLRLARTSADFTFSFAHDTSGLLAAMGVGTFFAGREARTVGLDANVAGKPMMIAAAKTNAPGDNQNVLDLIGLRETKIYSSRTATPEDFLRGIIGSLGVQSREAQDLLRNQESLTLNLANQRESISGVNLDEESLALIVHQRAFQAAARYISTIDELLSILLNL